MKDGSVMDKPKKNIAIRVSVLTLYRLIVVEMLFCLRQKIDLILS